MSWLSDLPGLPKRVRKLEEWRTNVADTTLAEVKQKLINQGAVIDGISADYVTMQAQIAALQAALDANDPAAMQAAINELAGIVDANNQRLVSLDESVPPPAPPQP
jgi:hypothetical protein